jgi:hypothetical protein
MMMMMIMSFIEIINPCSNAFTFHFTPYFNPCMDSFGCMSFSFKLVSIKPPPPRPPLSKPPKKTTNLPIREMITYKNLGPFFNMH